MRTFFLGWLAALGLCFGSFLTVVTWRFPRGESIVSPGSACPECGGAIRWHDNIPVVSWLALRGRCRRCAVAIPARYPGFELAVGVGFALVGATIRPLLVPVALVALTGTIAMVGAWSVHRRFSPRIAWVALATTGAFAVATLIADQAVK